MNTKPLLVVIFFLLSLNIHAGVEHLLPKPQTLTTGQGTFSLTQNIRLKLPDIHTNDPAIHTELTGLITANGGTVSENGNVSIEVQLTNAIKDAEFQEEAYSLIITAEKITIAATTLRGAFWGTQTLWQLADNAGGNLSICSITDWPAFRIRGFMQDIGRSYMDFEEIKKEIANLARYKINVFHWHLTEYQGWRLESKKFPQLNANASFTRHHGKYYTFAQARELVKWCSNHGVLLIPEIDMPGHSDAFTRAFGYKMQTDQGLATLKEVVTELIDSCFTELPIFHIGTDEVTISMKNFVPEMVQLIRAKGSKIGTWRRGYSGYNPEDLGLVHLWAQTSPLAGVPNVESNYHYLNHFDDYADVVGIYNTSIMDVPKQTADRAGMIMAIWNDRITRSDRDIVLQNNLYAGTLAMAERSWIGGGTYITRKGVMLDAPHTQAFSDFADWERRFLFHKANHLKNEPIAYVKQTNIHWRITDAYPNNGSLTASFPPENTQTSTTITDTCTINGQRYGSRRVTGAGIYLRHVWGPNVVPAFYSNPQTNSTAYAYTWVYSPIAQTVGARIEFQNYGRSEKDIPPRQGKWDYKGSRIWINDTEVMPPVWESQHTLADNETPLTNENASYRAPVAVNLIKGWNKVFIKLPVGAFSIPQVRLIKWMFSCVFTTTDGKNAVEGLIYSPEKKTDTSADVLITAIDEANMFRNSIQASEQPGDYSAATIATLDIAIAEAYNITKNNNATETEYQTAATKLADALATFKTSVNLPIISKGDSIVWYSLCTPFRNNLYVTYKGDNTDLIGEPSSTDSNKLWKVIKLSDGSHSLVSKVAQSYISPLSSLNFALKTQAGSQQSGGWNFTPTYVNKTFIITSGNVQFNQTNTSLNNKIYNWGNGTNFTDTGCRYLITEVSRNYNTTNVNQLPEHNIRIWAENRKLKVSGTAETPEVFSIQGVKLDITKPIENDIVIVKIGNHTQKITLNN